MRKIKPIVEEISLAFNPANGKKFFMVKETDMKDLLDIIESAQVLEKEEEVEKFLDTLIKSKQLSEKAANGVKGALKILNKYKDELPKGILSSLSNLVPEYGQYAVPVEKEEDIKKKCEELKNELRKELSKEYDSDFKKEMVDLRKEIADLKKETADAKAMADKEAKLRRHLEIKVGLEKDKVPGDIEKIARVAQLLEDIDDNLAKDFTSIIKESSTMLKAAGIFDEVGKTGGHGSSSAYGKLKTIVETKLEKEKVAPSRAWKDVIRENPELYKEYLNDRV